jgi:Zn-dependent peptidase ImmA (M78 family)/DNA-binding XRE family transcriptional regulator
MFNPARLTAARQRRKLTKRALADALGFDEKTIRRYEVEGDVPPADTLAKLAATLNFPIAFFSGRDLDELPLEAVSFRSLKSMLARDRDAALVAAAIAFLFDDWVADRFALPTADLFDLKEAIDPETAAQTLRHKWGLGDRPIQNMVHLLESKGVRVFSLSENTKNVDAFSLWRRNVPYVFLNTFKTAERSRFDAAHELGHLILHKHGGAHGGGQEAEGQANSFASAFLMPGAAVLAKMPRAYSLNQIIQAKKTWRVSAAALNYRLHKLGAVSDWLYRRINIQLSEAYRQAEPNGIAREVSLLWEKVFAQLRAEKITKHDIVDQLGLPIAEFESLIFGLSRMQSIDGNAIVPSKSRAKLRVVEQDA